MTGFLDIVSAYADVRSWLVFGVCLLVGLAWTSTRHRGSGSLPPGPWGIPVLGVIPRIMIRFKDYYKLYQEWTRKYGDVFSMRLGSHPAIIVSDPALVREAFVKQADIFSDRPVHIEMLKLTRDNSGLVIHNGPNLFHLRKFTMTLMKEFGVGKTSLEEKIHDEIKATFQEIDKYGGQPFNPRNILSKAVSNIINSMVFGTRFEYTDTRFIQLMEFMDYVAKSGGSASPTTFLPFVHILAKTRLTKFNAGVDLLCSYIRQKIEDHRVGFDENNIRDFIDLYLSIENEKGQGKISEKNMFIAIQDLFFGGSETTGTSLLWFMLYMILYPDVQRRCRHEILQVVGQGRLPIMADKASLVYTEATLLEMQRLASIATTSVPHYSTADAKLGGYFIPKGTVVMANFYTIHRDPRYWREPHKFDPERWIDESGKLVRSDAFMPFSVGRRACLGENLAKMEMFLYFTSLLQNYSFRAVDCPPDVEAGVQGLTRYPKWFTMVAKSV